jgi:phosphoglycolate phosphatase-like HAD superfamily hydrolase
LGIGIAITTGFPREILDRIIESLNWKNQIDVSVAASEVAYGRPAPDMVLSSMEQYSLKAGIEISPLDVAVVGDTPSDMGSGQFAHAAFVVGVTSGNSSKDELFSAGATQVLSFATQLLDVVN